MKQLIDTKNYTAIEEALSKNPALANEEIPYDEMNTTKAHPLHRICDGVCSGIYTDEEGIQMAKLFLRFGANINGNQLVEKKDTPLLAAASLHADKMAILYIDSGADIHHPGCFGGTALHWAAWCGREPVVRKLIQAGAEINKLCIDFKATPLFWAVHGLKRNEHKNNEQDYRACITLLMEAGADKNILSGEGNTVFDLLDSEDLKVREQLNTT